MSPSAFVTGSTGVLGLNLIDRLLTAGWRVTALRRPGSSLRYLSRFPVEQVSGDIESLADLLALIPDGTDAIFHLAADVSLWAGHRERQRRTNIDGTRNVVEAARRKGVRRLVHTSSIGVYGLRGKHFREDDPREGSRSWVNYFRTKAIGEEIVRSAAAQGLSAVILHPSNIVGRFDAHNWGRTFRLAARGKLLGAPVGICSYCHAGAAAAAHLSAYERGRDGESYLLGGTELSYLEAFRLVAELVGAKRMPVRLPKWFFRLYGRLGEWVSLFTRTPPDVTPEIAAMLCADQIVVSDKASRELGYRPVSARAMFEECHAWLKEERLL